MHEIEDAAVVSDYVVVVDVDRVDSVLTDHDSWIYTRLSGTVGRVIRVSKGHRMLIGHRIDVDAAPGELTIGKVLVMSEYHPGYDPGDDIRYRQLLSPHRSYLLFVIADPNSSALILGHTPLVVENGVLSYPWQTKRPWFEPPHPMQGLTLAEVTRVAQHAKKSWRETGGPRKKP